jgi:hypothetical protein
MAEPIFFADPVTVAGLADGHSVETTIMTCNPITVDTIDKTVTVWGTLNITPGTNAVTEVLKVKRGVGTGGTQVGTTTTTLCIATQQINIPFMVVDTPGESAGLVYTVTLAAGSGTVNGTVNFGAICALVSE